MSDDPSPSRQPEKLPFEFLLSPAFAADPYSAYAELRERGPVHPIDFPPGTTSFLVLDYEHGRAALSDPRLSKDPENAPEWYRAMLAQGDIPIGGNMLMADAPDHTRLRRVVSRAFTPRRVESLRPRIQQITDELIDAMRAKGSADLIEDFAFPLPIVVICELLGVPAENRERFREWSRLLITPAMTPEAIARRSAAHRESRAYYAELVAERRAEPRDDLVSALVSAAGEDDGRLTEAELISTLGLLLIAGHETTVNLIANGTLALLRNPDQLALLRERPDLMPAAVEEFLRYDSPVERSTLRVALEDMEIAGTPIPAKSFVHVSLAAVHRDPAAFPDPDRLEIRREDNRHVAFGHGPHFCVGAPLARLEGQIAFTTLLDRLPGLALDCPPEALEWRVSGAVVRGLAALPVRF
ncbi:cytochrome P450 [Thermocatellispora tengchongensis]|uniref:Cytochrome P450 n=1 Tax=Thermocatellispora tengchongensis TaxID=1073253 RepID=A0A840PMF5_9ACTN|nr:cytochrome P450 [Thermocatellispora tengchongensis]MBB5140252.1 cytochrome P450 [Thermocatellispora tengchongensis]